MIPSQPYFGWGVTTPYGHRGGFLPGFYGGGGTPALGGGFPQGSLQAIGHSGQVASGSGGSFFGGPGGNPFRGPGGNPHGGNGGGPGWPFRGNPFWGGNGFGNGPGMPGGFPPNPGTGGVPPNPGSGGPGQGGPPHGFGGGGAPPPPPPGAPSSSGNPGSNSDDTDFTWKPDLKAYPEYRKIEEWPRWFSRVRNLLHAQGLEEILDLHYVPNLNSNRAIKAW